MLDEQYFATWPNGQTLLVKHLQFALQSNVWPFCHIAKHCLTSKNNLNFLHDAFKKLSQAKNAGQGMFCDVAERDNHFFDKQISGV